MYLNPSGILFFNSKEFFKSILPSNYSKGSGIEGKQSKTISSTHYCYSGSKRAKGKFRDE